MATFSHHHHPSLPDSVFLPNTNSTFFSPFYPSNAQPFTETHTIDAGIQYDSSCLEHTDDNDTSVTKKQSTDSSSMDVKKRKKHLNSAQSKDVREVKGRKQRKCNVEAKKSNKKVGDDEEEAPLGYIHVRARRGQATDSHSLAERVRREKISERMKLLQGLVPGCDKVTGKALMLDEIINYVQSLQNQVEFLSMKLSSLNPMIYDFGVEPDAFMVRQERLNGLASPLPSSVQQCNSTPFTTTSSSNQFSLLDSSFLHQQGHWLNPYTQDNGSLLSDVDGQKQKFINQFGLTSNNMYFFH